MSHQLSENVAAEINSPVGFLLSLITEEEAKNSCTEENARKIFDMYCVNENNETLQPLDVRKMLFDILDAFKWPLVVPDESLQAVFEEISLNEKNIVTWVEFKSFFVFLQDRPLHKLLELVTSGFTPEDLTTSRLVAFDPTEAIKNACFEKALFQKMTTQLLEGMATKVYIHFLGGGKALALAIGDFDKQIPDVSNKIVEIANCPYEVTILPFNIQQNIFPPIQRAGGLCSKVARKLADMYVVTTEWDRRHLNIIERSTSLAKFAFEKYNACSSMFKFNILGKVAQKTVDVVTTVDSKLRFSSTVCCAVKRVNDCFDISGRIRFRLNKIKDSATVQRASTKLLHLTKTGWDTFDQISKETKQLVNEKEVELSTREEKQEETAEQHTDEISEAFDHAGHKMMAMDDEGDKDEGTIQPFSPISKT